MIEEKLEKLGVEKGSGSSVPNIHAPHARAASVSIEGVLSTYLFTKFVTDIVPGRPCIAILQAQQIAAVSARLCLWLPSTIATTIDPE